MKKIVRLTESDLVRLIEKVKKTSKLQTLSEQSAQDDLLKKKSELEAQLKKVTDLINKQGSSDISKMIGKTGGNRPHDKMVIDCLTKDGFKSANTNGKYDVYLVKDSGNKKLIVSSQQDPTKFYMNLMMDNKNSGMGDITISMTTNCNDIVKFANNPIRRS